jgi:transcriptional regulator with XRE-family HTH domain
MSRTIPVPVTPSVVRWAIEQSGYEFEHIAKAVGVPSALLEEWASGAGKPNLTRARKLASKLHRPFSALFLPAAPPTRALPAPRPQGERTFWKGAGCRPGPLPDCPVTRRNRVLTEIVVPSSKQRIAPCQSTRSEDFVADQGLAGFAVVCADAESIAFLNSRKSGISGGSRPSLK